jgi:hypothetical protein
VTEPPAFLLRHQDADDKISFGGRPASDLEYSVTAKKAGREIRPIFVTLSLDELPHQAASLSEPQGSDPAYLVSVGVVAAIVIGVFFGVGFSWLAETREQIIGGSGPRDRGTEVKPLHSVGFPGLSSGAQSVEVELPPSSAVTSPPVLALAQSPRAREDLTPGTTNPAGGFAPPAVDAAVSTTTGARSSAEAPAVRSAASEATRAPSATMSPSEPASGLPAAITPAMPSASSPLPAEVAELLVRGDSFVLIGDITSARVFYERAANAGDGRAALRMGTTFDPAFLRRAGLRRTFGDPVQARSWYRRAFDLGAVKAERRQSGPDRK